MACSTEPMPGKAGSSVGWTLTTRCGKRARNAGSSSCMYPARTTSATPRSWSQSAIAASRARRSGNASAANTRVGTPAASARRSARASRLSDPTATTSTASRPWTVSRIACRLEPSPDASTPTLTPPPDRRPSRRLQYGVVATARADRAGLEQRVHPLEHRLPGHVAERAVVRQPVPPVLEQHLGTTTPEHLDRARAPERRARQRHHLDDGLVERLDVVRGDGPLGELARAAAGAAAARRGGRRRRRDLRVAHVAAGSVGQGGAAVAEVLEDAAAPACRALDPGPDGAVLAPARARALLGRGAAEGERATVPRAGDPAEHAIGRRRARLHDARAGEVADDRAHHLRVA